MLRLVWTKVLWRFVPIIILIATWMLYLPSHSIAQNLSNDTNMTCQQLSEPDLFHASLWEGVMLGMLHHTTSPVSSTKPPSPLDILGEGEIKLLYVDHGGCHTKISDCKNFSFSSIPQRLFVIFMCNLSRVLRREIVYLRII